MNTSRRAKTLLIAGMMASLPLLMGACAGSRHKDRQGTSVTAHTRTQAPSSAAADVVLKYGHEASIRDQNLAGALLKRYFTVATHADGEAACSTLLAPSLPPSLPEDYGRIPTLPYLHDGKNCREIMTKLFKHRHSLLVRELASFHLCRLRVDGHSGYAVICLAAMPEREIPLERTKDGWRLEAIVDSPLP